MGRVFGYFRDDDGVCDVYVAIMMAFYPEYIAGNPFPIQAFRLDSSSFMKENKTPTIAYISFIFKRRYHWLIS